MSGVYAVSLAIGVVIFGWWIVAERNRGGSTYAGNVRRVTSLLVAFGMGGLSASYAGLSGGLAVILASIAAIGMVVYSDRVSADVDR